MTTANTALASLAYTPASNYDKDASATITVEDADGLTLTDTIILDVVPENEVPSATNTDQTITFTEDASSAPFTSIVISENDSIQASTDDTTASDDTTDETVTVTIALSDSSSGCFEYRFW